MKIGILQTGHMYDVMQAEFGDFDTMFRALLSGHEFTFETYNVVDGVFPSSPAECDGWLITGSKHGAYENHPWIPPLEDLIRDIAATGRPLIGICFGHQIIAQAMGGKVEKFDGGWAIGRQSYDWSGNAIALNASHQDQVVARPETATVIASNWFCENAALLYKDAILTIQPHPEFGSDVMAGLIETRGEMIPDTLLSQAKGQLDAELDNARIGEMMAAFMKTGTLPTGSTSA